jgi:hypothetical protein
MKLNFENPFNKHEKTKKNLVMIISFLTLSMGAFANKEAKALEDFNSFDDMETKSKNEYVALHNMMHDMGIDTFEYDAGSKHYQIIDKDGKVSYVETGDGNVIKIVDTNGDHIVDEIDIEGYVDGAIKAAPVPGSKKLDEAHLKRIKVSHTFTKDDQSLGNVSVGSSIALDNKEGQTAFLKTQNKFLLGSKVLVRSLNKNSKKRLVFQR